jgi:hypothetical protein
MLWYFSEYSDEETMAQIIYTLQFRGAAAPGGESGVMKATTSATSCRMDTTIGPDGVTGTFGPAEGGLAYFESEVRITAPDSFTESGTITFGESDHSIRFSTVGQGHMGPSADPKQVHGCVIWRVDGGEGQFEGATGLITSNFTLSDTGDVVDHHFGVIFLK